MAVRLKEVADKEGFALHDDAAVLIARIADGALRDGLSILDQCAGRSNDIDTALVSDVAGLAGRESLYKLSDCIADKDSAGAMAVISELYQNSFDMERLCVEMINHFRNFLVVKTVKKSRELIVCTDDEYNSILAGAKKFTLENVIYALDLFQNTLVAIKGGATARIETELAFVKLCEPKLEQTNDSLISRISALETAIKTGITVKSDYTESEPKPVPVTEHKPVQPEKKSEPEPASFDITEDKPAQPKPVQNTEPHVDAPAVQSQTTAPQPESDETVEFMGWGDFMDAIHKEDIALFGILSGAKGYTRGDFFLIDSQNETVRDFIRISTHAKAIKKSLYEVTGKKYKLGLFKHTQETAQKRDPLEDFISQAGGTLNIDLK